MDGGSLRSVAFRDEFRRLGLRPVWIGSCRSDVAGHSSLPGPRRKVVALLRTFWGRSNYVRERLASQRWRRAVQTVAKAVDASTVVWGNYYWSYTEWVLAGGSPTARIYLDTHNAEREWFENIARGTRNPLTRLVCRISIAHAERTLRSLPATVTLVHVSARDEAYYRALAPQCGHRIVLNGCRLRPLAIGVRPPGRPRLYFLGSLSVQMNYDALQNFAMSFWPTLRDICDFTVFGSNPSAAVRRLCQHHDWPLLANLPDGELDPSIANQDALVMPFGYSAGSKLKLVDALGRGKQVLATPAAMRELSQPPSTVLVGETGEDWRRMVAMMRLEDPGAARLSHAYAEQFSWANVIAAFVREESALHVQALHL